MCVRAACVCACAFTCVGQTNSELETENTSGVPYLLFHLFGLCLLTLPCPLFSQSKHIFGERLGRGEGLLFVCCLTSQQHASASQGQICSDNFTCCHAEIEVTDQTFHLTQSQYTDTWPTSSGTDPITPGVWQGSHWSINF